MNTIAIAILITMQIIGTDPTTGGPALGLVDQGTKMTVEECMTKADAINRDQTTRHVAVCVPAPPTSGA